MTEAPQIKTEFCAPLPGIGYGTWYAYVPGGLGTYGPTKQSAIEALQKKITEKEEREAEERQRVEDGLRDQHRSYYP